MTRIAHKILLSFLVGVALVLLTGASGNVSTARANFFNWIVDEQTNVGCYTMLTTAPFLKGDSTYDPNAAGPTSAYTMSPWTAPQENLTSVSYVNGADCSPTSTCLAVSFNRNKTAFSIDTRISQDSTTGKPRGLVLDFGQPCVNCSYGAGPTNPFGATAVSTPGQLSVFLTVPFTDMGICSTTDCPESETGTVRFWFDDPAGDKNVQYRVDWGFVRVLRVAANSWYVLADGCDGSQVATLYRLAGSRKKTTTRQGQYLVPFFATAAQ